MLTPGATSAAIGELQRRVQALENALHENPAEARAKVRATEKVSPFPPKATRETPVPPGTGTTPDAPQPEAEPVKPPDTGK